MHLSIPTLQFTDLIVFATCGMVFTCCWLLQREKSYFLLFGASFLLCALTSIGFEDFGSYGSWLSPLSWSLGGSLFWMGFRLFDGRTPLTRPMAVLTSFPTLLHIGLSAAGYEAATVNLFTTLAYVLHESAVAHYVLSTSRGSIIRRVAGLSLAAIAAAISLPVLGLSPRLEPLSLVVIVIVDHVTSIVLTTAVLALEAEKAYAALQDIAHRDPLTGALNRKGLDHRVRELRHPAGVVVADLDHFKTVNDRFGHAAGDHVLGEFVARATASLPKSALIARYGGEEFVVVLPDHDRKATAFAAERLRYAIQSRPIRWGEHTVAVTVSVGVTIADDTTGFDATLEKADVALYQAKTAGRNRVRIA